VPEVLVSVIVCVVGVDPSNCGEKIRTAGDMVIGCWQAVALFNARQMFPESSWLALVPLKQGFVFTTYAGVV